MAQTGYTPISLYYSTTAAAAPTAGNLVAGELALNTQDEKLYFKNAAGTVKLLASSSGASGDVVGPASATDNAIPTYDGTTGKLIKNNSGVTISSGTITATGFSGPLNGTVGATTPNTGAFTTLSSTGNTTLGDASTDTVTVNGYMGVGGAGSTTAGVLVSSAALTGASQFGVRSSVVGTASGTANVAAYWSSPSSAATAYTVTNVYGYAVANATKGAGSTITNQFGLYVNDLTVGDSNFGITSAVSSGANKYNIYASGTAENYFAGNIGIGAVAGSTTGQLRIAGNGSGATTFNGISLETSIQSGVTSAWRGLLVRPTTQATAFTLANLYGVYVNPQTFGAGSTVTNQFGFHAENTLTGATNNYGFYSNIASGTGRWNFYANGTADNYFAGNVGIGVTPTTKLDVSGTSRYTFNVSNAYTLQTSLNAAGSAFADDYKNALSHIWQTSGTERMRIDSSGNVGIGTSSPTAKLHTVVTDASSVLILERTGAGATSFTADFSGAVFNQSLSAGADYVWKEGGTEWMRLTNTGNVGIGTSSPSSKLEVYDATSAVARVTAGTEIFEIRNTGSEVRLAVVSADPMTFRTSNVEAMRIDSSGNVGIGTSSPASKLDVNGTIRDSIGNVRSIIQNAQTTGYTLVATDNGKHISITTGGVTVPASIFSAGDVVTIFNNSGSNQTITQGASVTLRFAGTATTGNRTLAQYGVCTVLCVASNTFVISGAGLT